MWPRSYHNCSYVTRRSSAFSHVQNGQFEIEVKTTATPEITTTMFDGDATDQKDYTLVEQTDDTIYIRARFTKKGY